MGRDFGRSSFDKLRMSGLRCLRISAHVERLPRSWRAFTLLMVSLSNHELSPGG